MVDLKKEYGRIASCLREQDQGSGAAKEENMVLSSTRPLRRLLGAPNQVRGGAGGYIALPQGHTTPQCACLCACMCACICACHE